MTKVLIIDRGKCICCQTHHIAEWSKSFCSRTCEHIWMRTDLQYTPIEGLRKIALARLAESNNK